MGSHAGGSWGDNPNRVQRHMQFQVTRVGCKLVWRCGQLLHCHQELMLLAAVAGFVALRQRHGSPAAVQEGSCWALT